jgi:hypothetical protein
MTAAIYYLNCKHEFEFSQTTFGTDLNKYLASNIPFGIFRRGDCICLSNEEERIQNEDVYIYDGRSFGPLEFTYNECGHVPVAFLVSDSEFTPAHWSEAIWHNYYFFPSDTIRERAKYSIQFGLLPGFCRPTYSSTFYIGSTSYTLVFNYESSELEDISTDVIELFQEKIRAGPWESRLSSCYLEREPDITGEHNYVLVA